MTVELTHLDGLLDLLANAVVSRLEKQSAGGEVMKSEKIIPDVAVRELKKAQTSTKTPEPRKHNSIQELNRENNIRRQDPH